MNRQVFSPKAEFQRHDDIKRELTKVIDAPNFDFCVSFAIAEYVYRLKPTREELTGATKFLEVLRQLPFQDAPMPDYPAAKLDYSIYEPQRAPQPRKE